MRVSRNPGETLSGGMRAKGYERVTKGKRSPEAQLWYEASRRALKNGLLFTIRVEDIKIPKFCPVFGIPLFHMRGTGMPGPNSPTLDRIDNTQGYTKTNICVISYRANMLKKDGTRREFEDLAKYCAAFEPIGAYDSTGEERGVYPAAV